MNYRLIPMSQVHYNNEYLWINIPSAYSQNDLQMTIYDLSGAVVFTKRPGTGRTFYELNMLSQGMYVVQIQNDKQLIKSQKIIRF